TFAATTSWTGCRGRRDDRREPPAAEVAPAADASPSVASSPGADGTAAGVATGVPADVPHLVVQGAAVPPRAGTLDACTRCRLARRPDAPAAPEGGLGPGTPLYAHDLLETPPGEAAELTLTGGGRLRLWPDSKLLLGLQRPTDLGLPQGGLTASAAPADGEPLRLFTPLGTVEPLAGRFVARVAAGGRGLLFLAPDAAETSPPLLADGLGGETPLVPGALHVLGPSTAPATSEPLAWEAGAAAPEASIERARVAWEARVAGVADERPATVLALARGLDGDLEALEAARAENRRLLAELERSDLPAAERDATRDALRESARRSVEMERALVHRWFRLELVVGATGVTTSAPWTLHAASGLDRRRARVEALLGGGATAGGH
ncbi:MAG: FecR domain-containing protein, partial [Myxococcales bacterium]|nr:FecR domain-containing protein [Myxococcales bacterium]